MPTRAGRVITARRKNPATVAPLPGVTDAFLLLEIEHHDLQKRPHHPGDDDRADRNGHHQQRPRRRAPPRLLRQREPVSMRWRDSHGHDILPLGLAPGVSAWSQPHYIGSCGRVVPQGTFPNWRRQGLLRLGCREADKGFEERRSKHEAIVCAHSDVNAPVLGKAKLRDGHRFASLEPLADWFLEVMGDSNTRSERRQVLDRKRRRLHTSTSTAFRMSSPTLARESDLCPGAEIPLVLAGVSVFSRRHPGEGQAASAGSRHRPPAKISLPARDNRTCGRGPATRP